MTKKIVSIRYYLFKMYTEGYTQEQMKKRVAKSLRDEVVTMDEIIDALVVSRFDELTAKNRLNKIVEALKGY